MAAGTDPPKPRARFSASFAKSPSSTPAASQRDAAASEGPRSRFPSAAETEAKGAPCLLCRDAVYRHRRAADHDDGRPAGGGAEEPGWIIAEISLEELWRTVDRIKVGTQGYALLLDEHGEASSPTAIPNDKGLIAQRAAGRRRGADLAEAALATQRSRRREPRTFTNARGKEELLAVGAAIDNPRWTVIVEQPTDRCVRAVAAAEESAL